MLIGLFEYAFHYTKVIGNGTCNLEPKSIYDGNLKSISLLFKILNVNRN